MKFLDPLDQGLTVYPFLLVVEKYFDARLVASLCFLGGGVSTSKGSLPVVLALPLFANEADLLFLVVVLAIVGGSSSSSASSSASASSASSAV
jgi:hypothetical protein